MLLTLNWFVWFLTVCSSYRIFDFTHIVLFRFLFRCTFHFENWIWFFLGIEGRENENYRCFSSNSLQQKNVLPKWKKKANEKKNKQKHRTHLSLFLIFAILISSIFHLNQIANHHRMGCVTLVFVFDSSTLIDRIQRNVFFAFFASPSQNAFAQFIVRFEHIFG